MSQATLTEETAITELPQEEINERIARLLNVMLVKSDAGVMARDCLNNHGLYSYDHMGFVPADPDWLETWLESKGLSTTQMIDTGLFDYRENLDYVSREGGTFITLRPRFKGDIVEYRGLSTWVRRYNEIWRDHQS